MRNVIDNQDVRVSIQFRELKIKLDKNGGVISKLMKKEKERIIMDNFGKEGI